MLKPRTGKFIFDLTNSRLMSIDADAQALLDLPQTEHVFDLTTLIVQTRLQHNPYLPLRDLCEAFNVVERDGEILVAIDQQTRCYLKKSDNADKVCIEGELTKVTDNATTLYGDNYLFDRDNLYQLLFKQANVGVVVRDVNTEEIYEINDKYLDLIGVNRAELDTFRFRQIAFAEDQAKHDELDRQMKLGKLREYSVEKRYIRKDGTTVWALITCKAIWILGQAPNAIIAIAQEITDTKITQSIHKFIASRNFDLVGIDFLEKLASFVSAQLDNAKVLISLTEDETTSLEQEIVVCAPKSDDPIKYQKFLPSHELTSHRAKTPILIKKACSFYTEMDSNLPPLTSQKNTLYNWIRAEGGAQIGLVIIVPKMSKQIPICRDVSEIISTIISAEIIHYKNQKEIWHQANYDSLTNIPNRRHIKEIIESEIKRLKRSKEKSALLLLDLDEFKEINDSLGHAIGDILLRSVAQRLSSVMRETDMIGRLGGDEFIVLVKSIDDISTIPFIAEKIKNILSNKFVIQNQSLYISCSLGITIIPDDSQAIDVLLSNADQAMYAAKAAGKNQFHFFTPTMNEQLQRKSKLAQLLRGAIDRQELSIVLQPIFNVQENRFTKAEVLLRWFTPDYGQISPIEFIPLAERTGLIHDIGNWVFNHACSMAQEFRRDYAADFQLCINISAIQFRPVNGVLDYKKWLDLIEKADIDYSSIILEITESVLIEQGHDVESTIEAMQNHGIEFAIDDFGTGYSSMAYLKRFDIDYLKIDQEFVRNIRAGSEDEILCRAIVAMSHALGIEVVAEGVELNEHVAQLETMGVNYLQGFYLAKPMPVEELKALLYQQNSSSHDASVVAKNKTDEFIS